MIRVAILDDFEEILDLCEDFWEHTQFEEPFERSHTVNMVDMSYDHGLLAVLEIDGKVEGFAAGIKAPLMGNSSVLAGTELAWWVNPEKRSGGNGIKLLKFIEDLAKTQNVKYWNMVSMQSSMPDQVNRMYEKMGYKLEETTYTKVL